MIRQGLRHYLAELARTHKDKQAMVFESADGGIKTLSYAKLDELSNKSANALLALGVKPKSIVAINLSNSLEWVLAFFGALKIGAIALPLNINLALCEINALLKQASPKVLISHEKTGLCKLELSADEFMSLLKDKSAPSSPHPSPSDIAQIIYTSGTSAKAKGVLITHYNLIWAGLFSSWQIGLNENDRYLSAMGLYHIDAQCTTMMPCLSRGACFISLAKYSAHKFWHQLIAHKASITELIPKMMLTLLAQERSDDDKKHSLRLMLHYLPISKKAFSEFISRFKISQTLSSYGMSETIVGVLGDRVGEERRFGSIGRVGMGYDVGIFDENDNLLPPNTKGEIRVKGVRGKTLFKGYYKSSAKSVFKNGWLKTGDVGYVDDDGYFYFVDRASNLIKVAGENVSSEEVRACINSHPKVADSAVIGIKDSLDECAIKAFVLPKGARLSASEILEHCKSRLAKFKVPKIILLVSDLPRTSTGKIQIAKLKELS